MDRLIHIIQDVGDSRLGGADSFTDRMSCRHTVTILAIFALMVTTRQYVNEPISCWCPNDFTNSNVDFVNKVCWTTSTYYLPPEDTEIPAEKDHKRHISYYQWVSVILVAQSFFFYFPRLLWVTLSEKSGIAVYTITDAAIERQRKSESDAVRKIMDYTVKNLGKYLLENNRNVKSETRCERFMARRVRGNYIYAVYLFIKVVYLVNIGLQFKFLNLFLSNNFYLYGVETIKRMFYEEVWSTSDRFPRIAMCDFKIRVLGNIHRHTVQCALPMNLLNEIFFTFLWFWFIFLGAITTLSLFMWIMVTARIESQVQFLSHRLYVLDRLKGKNNAKYKVERFVKDYLRRDGCFILRLVAKNSSDLVAAELISGLWTHYKENKRKVVEDHEIQTPGPSGRTEPMLDDSKEIESLS